jgi:hypothetical protein
MTSQLASVRATVVVDLAPAEAFDVFTTEIEAWYRRGAATLGRRGQDRVLRFERHLGGRVLSIRDDGRDGHTTEIGRITCWEPGRRLGFVDRRRTEVEVSFEPVGRSTQVVLEHRGLDRLPPDMAAALGEYGFRRLPLWFESYVKERST